MFGKRKTTNLINNQDTNPFQNNSSNPGFNNSAFTDTSSTTQASTFGSSSNPFSTPAPATSFPSSSPFGGQVNSTLTSFGSGPPSNNTVKPPTFGEANNPVAFGSGASASNISKPRTFGEAKKPVAFGSGASASNTFKPATFGEAKNPVAFGASTSNVKPNTFGEAKNPVAFGASTSNVKPATFGAGTVKQVNVNPFGGGGKNTAFKSTAFKSGVDKSPTFGGPAEKGVTSSRIAFGMQKEMGEKVGKGQVRSRLDRGKEIKKSGVGKEEDSGMAKGEVQYANLPAGIPPEEAEAYFKAIGQKPVLVQVKNRVKEKTVKAKRVVGGSPVQKPVKDTTAISPARIVEDDDDERLTLDGAQNLDGTCVTMCSQKEIEFRTRTDELSAFEKPFSTPSPYSAGNEPENLVIKRLQRSSADHKLDIPSEVRTPEALEKTQSYLEQHLMDRDSYGIDERLNPPRVPDLIDLYNFCWDRARMIRKDFTLQNYCGGGRMHRLAVNVYERIARFFVMAEHELCEEKNFVAQQNMEQLVKTLVSLSEFYDGAFASGDTSLQSPFEAEFRAYFILCTMDTGGGLDVLRGIVRLRKEIRDSKQVHFAMNVFLARKRNDYHSFFKMLKEATYLQACLMHRYILGVRDAALEVLKSSMRKEKYPLEDLSSVLEWDNSEQAIEECVYHGLEIVQGDSIQCVSFTAPYKTGREMRDDKQFLPVHKSIRIIDAKKKNLTRGQICRGPLNQVVSPTTSLVPNAMPIQKDSPKSRANSLRVELEVQKEQVIAGKQELEARLRELEHQRKAKLEKEKSEIEIAQKLKADTQIRLQEENRQAAQKARDELATKKLQEAAQAKEKALKEQQEAQIREANRIKIEKQAKIDAELRHRKELEAKAEQQRQAHKKLQEQQRRLEAEKQLKIRETKMRQQEEALAKKTARRQEKCRMAKLQFRFASWLACIQVMRDSKPSAQYVRLVRDMKSINMASAFQAPKVLANTVLGTSHGLSNTTQRPKNIVDNIPYVDIAKRFNAPMNIARLILPLRKKSNESIIWKFVVLSTSTTQEANSIEHWISRKFKMENSCGIHTAASDACHISICCRRTSASAILNADTCTPEIFGAQSIILPIIWSQIQALSISDTFQCIKKISDQAITSVNVHFFIIADANETNLSDSTVRARLDIGKFNHMLSNKVTFSTCNGSMGTIHDTTISNLEKSIVKVIIKSFEVSSPPKISLVQVNAKDYIADRVNLSLVALSKNEAVQPASCAVAINDTIRNLSAVLIPTSYLGLAYPPNELRKILHVEALPLSCISKLKSALEKVQFPEFSTVEITNAAYVVSANRQACLAYADRVCGVNLVLRAQIHQHFDTAVCNLSSRVENVNVFEAQHLFNAVFPWNLMFSNFVHHVLNSLEDFSIWIDKDSRVLNVPKFPVKRKFEKKFIRRGGALNNGKFTCNLQTKRSVNSTSDAIPMKKVRMAVAKARSDSRKLTQLLKKEAFQC